MANKRFVKPLRYDLDGNVLTPELIGAKARANAAVADALSSERMAAREKLAREEYRYCLAEARRLHPEWTLKQRQEYARNSAHSLFD